MTQFSQGVANQGFGTYFSPLMKEFGWSRALLASPRAITQAENAILGPLEGWLMDKFGPRIMVASGTLVMGLGLILFGLTNSLWMYILANVVIVFGTGFQGLLVLSTAVNHWFRRRRTFAQSVMLLGFAMAGVIGIPALVYVQSNYGWRAAAIGTGVIIWIIGLPMSYYLRRSPEEHGLLPDGDKPDDSHSGETGRPAPDAEHDFTLRQAIRTKAFWFLGLGQSIGGMGMASVQVHLFLHLEQGVGLDTATGAFVWTVASLSNIPSRLIGGYLGDRLSKRLILGSTMVLMSVSIFVLGLATSLQGAMVYAVLYGIAWGARTPIMNAIQGDYFGRKSQGIIRGWLNSLTLPLRMAAPILVGFIADIQDGYRMIFLIGSFVALAGSILIFMAFPPKPPISEDNDNVVREDIIH